MSPQSYAGHHRLEQTTRIRTKSRQHHPPKRTTFYYTRRINIAHRLTQFPQPHPIFITFLLSATRLAVPMANTRKKNKSVHPGAPDMTPSRLAAAGLSHLSKTRRPPKQLTKDQRIAALEEELRIAREFAGVSSSTLALLNVSHPCFLKPVQRLIFSGATRYGRRHQTRNRYRGAPGHCSWYEAQGSSVAQHDFEVRVEYSYAPPLY